MDPTKSRQHSPPLRFASVVALGLSCLGAVVSCTESADEQEVPRAGAPRSMEEQPLDIALVADSVQVLPGQTFFVGLRIQPEDGFHTYWKNPGVVGIPTAIDWHLPEGWQAGEIEWPAPGVVMMGPYPAHGYYGDVLLPVPIRVPENAAAGEVTLRGDARWMCCADTCHPGFRSLEVTVLVLPPGAQPAESADAPLSDLFAAALEARPLPARGFEFTAERDATGVTIVIRGDGGAGVDATPLADLAGLRFYCDQGIISSDQEQMMARGEDGSVRLRLAASPFGPEAATRLTGVFESESGWYLDEDGRTVRHIQVAMPLPPAPVL